MAINSSYLDPDIRQCSSDLQPFFSLNKIWILPNSICGCIVILFTWWYDVIRNRDIIWMINMIVILFYMTFIDVLKKAMKLNSFSRKKSVTLVANGSIPTYLYYNKLKFNSLSWVSLTATNCKLERFCNTVIFNSLLLRQLI